MIVCVGGGEEVCEEEVGVCEGTVDYVVDIILYILEGVCEEVCVCVCEGTVYYVVDIIMYILEEVCEEEVCVCEGAVYYVLNIIVYILCMTNYISLHIFYI